MIQLKTTLETKFVFLFTGALGVVLLKSFNHTNPGLRCNIIAHAALPMLISVSELYSNKLVTGASSSSWWILLTDKFGGIIRVHQE
jgi:hypothetical protein